MTAPKRSDDDDSRSNSTMPFMLQTEPLTTSTSSLPVVTSLYRKYRPQSFASEELVGQDHIIRTLRNALSLGRVAHAYLFCGPRGTGKTTTARIVAKAVNCLHEDPMARPCNVCANCLAINANATPDVIEIDAASNRGIDDIRDLRDRVRYAPTTLRSKVYIIDEAHQITGAAANAFLKTLEEPPSHSRFILATTDPEESCQRSFRAVSDSISVASRSQIWSAACGRSPNAKGSTLRTMLCRSLPGKQLEAFVMQLVSSIKWRSYAAVRWMTSTGRLTLQPSAPRSDLSLNDRIEAIVTAVVARNPGDALSIVQAAVDSGEDPRQLNRQLVSYLRLLLLERSGAPADADDRARSWPRPFNSKSSRFWLAASTTSTSRSNILLTPSFRSKLPSSNRRRRRSTSPR